MLNSRKRGGVARTMASIMQISSFAVALALAAAMMAGCSSIRVSNKVGKTMIDVENNGWLLFNCIPIASGNIEEPGGWCHIFSNTVTLDNNIDLVDIAVKQEGALGVRDLVSYTTDEYVLFILLKRHSMHTSAELVMPGDTHRMEDVKVIENKKIRAPESVEVNTGDSGVELRSPVNRPSAGRGIKVLEF